MIYYNVDIGMASLLCGFSHVSANDLIVRRLYCKTGICMVSLRCELLYALLNQFLLQILYCSVPHWYGFSPVWVLKCFCKSLHCANALVQYRQGYGFSPVWVLTVHEFLKQQMSKMVSLLYGIWCVQSALGCRQNPYHNTDICRVSLLYEFSYVSAEH